MLSDPKQRSESQNPVPSQADGYAVAPKVPQPFQPRLIHPDPAPVDNEGELQLPDDLAALAEQLQDDVVYLSNCYPPEAPQRATPHSSATAGSPTRTRLSGATAGSPSSARLSGATAGLPSSAPMRIALLTTAAAAIAVALSIPLFANRQQPADQAERPQQPAAADSSTVQPQNQIASKAGQGPEVEPLALDQSESLLLLGEATGPEREGLLDLLQQTASTETGISF